MSSSLKSGSRSLIGQSYQRRTTGGEVADADDDAQSRLRREGVIGQPLLVASLFYIIERVVIIVENCINSFLSLL